MKNTYSKRYKPTELELQYPRNYLKGNLGDDETAFISTTTIGLSDEDLAKLNVSKRLMIDTLYRGTKAEETVTSILPPEPPGQE